MSEESLWNQSFNEVLFRENCHITTLVFEYYFTNIVTYVYYADKVVTFPVQPIDVNDIIVNTYKFSELGVYHHNVVVQT